MIKAFGDKILIQEVKPVTKTDSGIILSRSTDTSKAKVLSVGSKVVDVKEGDIVFVDWSKSQPISGDDSKVFIREQFVIAVVDQMPSSLKDIIDETERNLT